MTPSKRRRLAPRERRLLFLLFLLLAIAAWKFVPRPWHPATTLETQHYSVRSSASRQQTDETARVVEQLYTAYSNRFGALPKFNPAHSRLQMKLYKDRDEFRRINPGLGWAEAFYRRPYCQAYYSSAEINSYHWMLHEATHQLNEEVAHVDPAKWLEEGLSEYFSTSRFIRDRLVLGTIDPNTYPVWWIDELATTPDLKANLENGSVIPLRAIVTGHGGPSMKKQFNLYYLHWWSLTHFVFQSEKHREHAADLLNQGAGLATFEKLIGPIDQVQIEWHNHVRRIKSALNGHDIKFTTTGELP